MDLVSKYMLMEVGNDKDDVYGKKHVLFVYFVKNVTGFNGFRLTNSNYSAFYSEQEYLISEGFQVWVLGIEDKVIIRNNNDELKKFNGKCLTIIYLYNEADH